MLRVSAVVSTSRCSGSAWRTAPRAWWASRPGRCGCYVERGAPHGPVFDFLVPDVAAVRDRLVAAGCTVIEEDPDLPRCYLRDPFGMTFNLGRKASS